MSEIKIDKRNYRKHSDRNKSLINKSLSECGAGRSILIDNENSIVAGNGLFEQSQKLGIPIRVIETDGTELIAVKRTDLATDDEKRKQLAIMDNSTSDSSEFDMELLTDDFDVDTLSEFGVDVADFDLSNTEENESNETNPIAENYINKAWEKACGEILEQYKKLEGFSFYTPNISKINFIKFLFYGKRYPRSSSLAFHARQFRTKGCSLSLLEGLERIASSKIGAGYLRMLLYDDFPRLLKIHLPFSGARMPLDFPVDLARDLINEFGNNGKVLDPCAGWGGRLVGFLASTAVEYQGIDASPYQVQGDLAIYECYKDVIDENKKVSIICSPFEKFEIEKEYYDMALTSPPYFDVEIYEGGEQSSDYGSYEKWKDCFFSVLFSKVYKALKKKGIFCLQVGSQKYPLEKDGIQLACEVGFEHIESRGTKMINTKEKTEEENMERIVIFRKP